MLGARVADLHTREHRDGTNDNITVFAIGSIIFPRDNSLRAATAALRADGYSQLSRGVRRTDRDFLGGDEVRS